MGWIEKAQTPLWVTLWECDETAHWLSPWTHNSKYMYGHRDLNIFKHWHIWVRNIWVFFLLQKVKMKLLTTAFRAYFRKGYNLRSHLLVKYKRLAYMLTTGTDTCSCMYMYRPDGNRWRDEDHNTCIRSRLIYHRHSWDIRTFHVGPPYWDIRKIHTHTLKYISNVCLNSGVKDMQENKKIYNCFVWLRNKKSLLWLCCLFLLQIQSFVLYCCFPHMEQARPSSSTTGGAHLGSHIWLAGGHTREYLGGSPLFTCQ